MYFKDLMQLSLVKFVEIVKSSYFILKSTLCINLDFGSKLIYNPERKPANHTFYKIETLFSIFVWNNMHQTLQIQVYLDSFLVYLSKSGHSTNQNTLCIFSVLKFCSLYKHTIFTKMKWIFCQTQSPQNMVK